MTSLIILPIFKIPPEQKDLQAAVFAGADAYGAHHSRQNVMYQTKFAGIDIYTFG